jgi:hypothetical protein
MLNFKAFIFFMISFALAAHAVDQDLAAKLKKDLVFDVERRNDFKKHSQNKKVYEVEREKSLALYLEEQEKWDIAREKGLKTQRNSRSALKEMDEQSSEFKQDQKEKAKYDLELETARKKHNETKKQITQCFENKIAVSEADELEIYNLRPRFDLRHRGQNKWTKKSSGSSGGSSAGSSGSGSTWGGASGDTGSSTPFDYPASGGGDYIPSDNFDDLPPPPPLVPYDGYGNGQNSVPPYYNNENGPDFGPGQSSPLGYPTPPPEGGWDF